MCKMTVMEDVKQLQCWLVVASGSFSLSLYTVKVTPPLQHVDTKYKVTADHQHEGKGHSDEEGGTFTSFFSVFTTFTDPQLLCSVTR